MGLRRSTFFTAGLLAVAAAAMTASPAAALSVAPGALSSFRVSGGLRLGEASQGSAQQCLDACFGVADCNAASFCVGPPTMPGGPPPLCEGGRAPGTCAWFRVDDPSNPPGEASAGWLSGTISVGQQDQQQQQQQVPQQQQPQQVFVANGGGGGGGGRGRGVSPVAVAAATAVIVRRRNQNPHPIIPVPPIIHPLKGIIPPGRRMQSAAAVATTAVIVRRRNQNPAPIIPVPPVVLAHPAAAAAAVSTLPVGGAAAATAIVVRNRNQNPAPIVPVPPVVRPFGVGRRMMSKASAKP